jgi:chromosome segregation ATPase
MPKPAAEDVGEPAPLPVGTEAFAALAGRVSGLEDQDNLLRELRTHLRETREQLVAGEARLGALEAILAEFSQTYAALNARLDAQTRDLDDLRRITAEQATRITTAGRALLG